jgi:hypothetical protein
MAPAWTAPKFLKHLATVFGLMLFLISGQQGAVVHELGHFAGAHTPDLSKAGGDSADPACALCPSFAQAASPALSHSFVLPLLVRAYIDRRRELPILAATSAAPAPRSRGPPFAS